MGQHRTDEAGYYGNDPWDLCFSEDNKIPGSVIKLRWQLEFYDTWKNVEIESQKHWQTSR